MSDGSRRIPVASGSDTLAAIRPKPFIVGANMPWWSSGHDFGFHPHGWGDTRPRWDEVEQQLRILSEIGITVVRWFILGAGVSYPCRASATARQPNATGLYPQAIDDYAKRVFVYVPEADKKRVRPGEPFEWHLTYPLPPLSWEFIEDFLQLCRLCQTCSLQLLPSLISFEWFKLPFDKGKGIYGGGRRALIFDNPKSDLVASVNTFLDATLQPLIAAVTKEFGPKHPIFAWESINEPDWVTQGGATLLEHTHHPVPAADMNLFLAAFRERVLAAGFDHSIGFKQLAPGFLAPQLRELLISDGDRYWHQAHHFPTIGLDRLFENTLATNRKLARKPHDYKRCLVGEFSTARATDLTIVDNYIWGDKELRITERKEDMYLYARWELIRDRGYDGALAWGVKSTDSRSNWSLNSQQQTRDFATGKSRAFQR